MLKPGGSNFSKKMQSDEVLVVEANARQDTLEAEKIWGLLAT